MRPIIGITTRRENGDYSVSERYVKCVMESGGIPLLLCPGSECIDLVHGLVFTGGGDFVPPPQNGVPALSPARLIDVDPERDQYETALVHEALARALPMLGICRGHQLINLALGGTLYYDLNAAGFYEPHSLPPIGRHRVFVPEESHLYSLLGGKLFVNSHHHQGINEVADGLHAAAFSAAGIVEALENAENTILTVQWHPERMQPSPIFDWICNKACSYLAKQIQTV